MKLLLLDCRLAALGLVAWFASVAPLTAATPEERAIAEWALGRKDEMIRMLEQAVRISSPSEDIPGVRAMGDFFAAEFRKLGFEPRWIPLPPETKRAGHLFAERKGGRGKRLLLIGHLDTVLPGGAFTRERDRGRGSGANDMKGGDVVLIYALKALQAAGALDGTQIIIAFTGDEESIRDPLDISRRDLIDAARRSEIALAFETARKGEATVARRGSSSWELEVTGPTGHSSGIFSPALGSGAAYEAARIIDRFHAELRKLPGLTANVAMFAGGAEIEERPFSLTATGKDNIIPSRAVVRGDLRAISPEQLAQAERVMRDIAADTRLRTEARLKFRHRYPPMATSPRNLEVLAVYDAVSRELGYGPVAANDPTQRGAGDSAFAAPYNGVLDGLGPYGSGAHAANESVDLASLPVQAARAALLIYRLTR